MKFYKEKSTFDAVFFNKIFNFNLSAIYCDSSYCEFFKNGQIHNYKNASIIDFKFKKYFLNNKYYGCEYEFTKKSWRKFVRELKLQAFL